MSTPQVTVLLTVYNGLPHVSETIEAVLAQRFDDFEFLIVDDGSNDGTRDLLVNYDDHRLRTLFLDHVGRGRALNAGLIDARGEFVAIIDADDVPSPDWLERKATHLEQHPEIDVLCSCVERHWTGADRTEIVCPELTDDPLQIFTDRNPIPHSTTVYRQSAAARVGGYDESLSSCIDYDFWVRLARADCQFATLDATLGRIRKHEDQSFRVEGLDRLEHHLNSFRVRGSAIVSGGGSHSDRLQNLWRFGGAVCHWTKNQL